MQQLTEMLVQLYKINNYNVIIRQLSLQEL